MAVRRARLAGCLVAAVCALGAAPLPATAKHRAKPAYADGAYTGTVAQNSPFPGARKIRFLVSRRSLSGLSVDVAEVCSQIVWTAVTDAPKTVRIPIAGDGSFSYDKTVLGDHLTIKGRLRGNQATGTFFDALSSGTLACTMGHASNFTAKH